MPGDGARDRLTRDEIFQTFEDRRGIDDDSAATVAIPIQPKPNPDDSATAVPEVADEEGE